MLEYKIDILHELQEMGYSTYRIRKENLLSQSTITKLNQGEMIGINVLERVCSLLDMQPGNIIKYVPDEDR